jgi:hypothetical protein
MGVLVIVSVRDNPGLVEEIEEKFSGKYIRLASNTWALNSTDNPVKIAEELGAGKENARRSGVVILRCAPAYYGRASASIWEWLESAFEKSSDG